MVELSPSLVSMARNYPNPFNCETLIEFNLNESSDISVVIYNLLGEKIDILLNEPLSSGFHSLRWDGSGKSTGIYFYRIVSGNSSFSGKMSVLK